jgi:hypothetical protein
MTDHINKSYFRASNDHFEKNVYKGAQSTDAEMYRQ